MVVTFGYLELRGPLLGFLVSGVSQVDLLLDYPLHQHSVAAFAVSAEEEVGLGSFLGLFELVVEKD